MCSVGDMFDVDISGDATMSEYECGECGKEFKGIGKNLRCPKCHSLKVSKKIDIENKIREIINKWVQYMNSSRDEFKINILRDVTLYECICRDCGNKFRGLPVDNIQCPACHSSNISKK